MRGFRRASFSASGANSIVRGDEEADGCEEAHSSSWCCAPVYIRGFSDSD